MGAWHYGWWWMMMPVMFVFWGAAGWFVVSLVRGGGPGPDDSGRAERILGERYARGEIGADDYRRRLEDIRK